MRAFLRSLAYAATSIGLVLAVFASGYYLGQAGSNLPVLDGRAAAAEPADLSTFWKVWQLVDQKYQPAGTSTTPDGNARVEGAIRGLVGSLGDPYTDYFSAKEKGSFDDALSGSLEGVGMELGKADDLLTVIAPLKGSPAERAGVRPGDVVLKIDDVASAHLDVSEAVTKIRGKAGTTVKLSLGRKGEEAPIDVSIVRERIRVPSVEWKRLPGGVLRLTVSSFTEDLGEQLKDALAESKAKDGDKILLDLRGDPGGYLSGAIEAASWFLPAGESVVRERSTGQPEDVMRSQGYKLFGADTKIAVLLDRGSASASEILAGALAERAKAKLFGERSFGKGTVQEVVDLPDGAAIKITVAEWLTPGGKSISHVGITPDVLVADDPATKVDEVEQAATNYLLGK